MISNKKEMGGYLPIELNKNGEYYSGGDVLALNAARYAVIVAMKVGGFKRIYIPTYMCYSVFEALDKYGIQYVRYHITEEFEPDEVEIDNDECIMLVNYFGVVSEERIERLVNKYRNVIIDNTQSFFAEPIMSAFNVYSCRKFIGVSDGAYLVHADINIKLLRTGISLKQDVSSGRILAMMGCVETSTNAEYHKSLDAEDSISASEPLLMSELTKKILNNADYSKIAKMRELNYKQLSTRLAEKNGININKEKQRSAPMVYPLLSEKRGLREYLVNNKIYVPHWWRYLDEFDLNKFERRLVNGLIPLPIDQRYDSEDMEYMADIVNAYIC